MQYIFDLCRNALYSDSVNDLYTVFPMYDIDRFTLFFEMIIGSDQLIIFHNDSEPGRTACHALDVFACSKRLDDLFFQREICF